MGYTCISHMLYFSVHNHDDIHSSSRPPNPKTLAVPTALPRDELYPLWAKRDKRIQCSFKLKMSLDEWLSSEGKNAALFKEVASFFPLNQACFAVVLLSSIFVFHYCSVCSYPLQLFSTPANANVSVGSFFETLGNDRLPGLKVCIRRNSYQVREVVIK